MSIASMDFELPDEVVRALLDRIAPESPLRHHLKQCGVVRGRTVVRSRMFDAEALHALYDIVRSTDERSLMFQLLALDNIHSAPKARAIPKLEVLINGLIAYLRRDAMDGWLYRRGRDGVLLPWLVTSMRHVVPSEGKPYVIISLLANTMQAAAGAGREDARRRHAGMTQSVVVDANDIARRTIPELLAEHGYFKECREFRQEYEAHVQRFRTMQRQFGAQFLALQGGFVASARGEMDYLRLPERGSVRCVNDEERLERHFDLHTDGAFWREAGIDSGFDEIPVHTYLHLFHLELHRNLWVHVQNVDPYAYRPELRHKLVLPDSHRDLVDILTTDLALFFDDIVEGKSGGRTVLCKGAPGLGKTLTAEVYAEAVGKPLYRVHSGQLGVTAESVEASLTQILQRAARWGAILLIDEADVYIRRRDNDLQHNAIVAEFLRTLEYFDGLLFMTTNRDDDVDDAILSRCIAVIHYDTPPRDAARRLWRTLSDQFGAALEDDLVESLLERYPRLSGRDIKELLKLVLRFSASRGAAPSLEMFATCAAFRSIDPVSTEA